jgi:hypothetical protein
VGPWLAGEANFGCEISARFSSPVSDDEARPQSGCSGGPARSGMVIAIPLPQFSARFRPCNKESFLVVFATGKPSQTERDEKSESRPWSSR